MGRQGATEHLIDNRSGAVLLALGGISVSLAIFWSAGRADLRRVTSDLEVIAQARAGEVQDRIIDAAVAVEATADFIPSQLTIDQAAFGRFAALARGVDPVSRLAWVPLAPDRDAARLDRHFDDGSIEEDAEADPPIVAVADEARDTGQPVAVLAGRTYRVVWPVYGHDLPPSTQAERRRTFSGVVVGELPFHQLIRFAFHSGRPVLATIRLYIGHGEGEAYDAPLALIHPGRGDVETTAGLLPRPEPGGVRLFRSFEQFGRNWTLVSDFPPDLVDARRSDARWGYLVTGLVMTSSAVAYLLLERQRRRLAEIDAAERARALAASQTLLGAIVSSSDDALISKTLDGVVTTWNQGAERIFGYLAEEIIGRPIGVLAVPGREDDMRAVLERIRRGARVDHYETQRRRKDGAIIDISLSVSPICDADGRIVGASKIARDITAAKASERHRQQLAAQLHQAQKMEAVGELTGGLAHDFNNILSAILGNLDFLSEKFRPGTEGDEFTKAAISAAEKGAQLIRRLLAFARRQPLAPKPTYLDSILTGAGELFRRTLGADIELRVILAEDLWPVMIDAAQLESALLNLAVNSRHAMPNGGILTIEARNVSYDEISAAQSEAGPGDFLAISISDTGCGMPPDVLARVFEPFFTTKGSQGSGLGLSMVHGFVKQSGGYTRIYSEPGHGTTVRLYLPRAEAIEEEASQAALTDVMARGHEVVLVVEDNPAVREVAVRRLHELGYQTVPADGGEEGLAVLRGDGAIDLLFTDIVMPGGISGRELAAMARQLRPGMPVLFTSGFTAAAASAAMRDEFGPNLLSKPYRKTELARRVRAALDHTF